MYHQDEHFSLNRRDQKDKRRELRKNCTPAEAVMWKRLRARQMDGLQWKRQVSLDAFVMDFYCPAARLCVELDGATHFTPEGSEHDENRTAYLEEKYGIQVLRFENKLFFERSDEVIEYIRQIAQERIAFQRKSDI